MIERTVSFSQVWEGHELEMSLVYPEALQKLTLPKWKKLVQIMRRPGWDRDNNDAIKTTIASIEELIDEIEMETVVLNLNRKESKRKTEKLRKIQNLFYQ